MSVETDRAAASYVQAFTPAAMIPSATTEQEAAIRLAHAAEYAAAQLGFIARAAERIEAHLAKIAVHYPAPGSSEAAMQAALSAKTKMF
jgi:hypothetical protein